jgi:hypothetical protein
MKEQAHYKGSSNVIILDQRETDNINRMMTITVVTRCSDLGLVNLDQFDYINGITIHLINRHFTRDTTWVVKLYRLTS